MLPPNHPMSRINAIDYADVRRYAETDQNEYEGEPVIAHGKLVPARNVYAFSGWAWFKHAVQHTELPTE